MNDLGWGRAPSQESQGGDSSFLDASHKQNDLGQVTHPKGLLILSPDTLRVVPPHATGDICQTVSFLFVP